MWRKEPLPPARGVATTRVMIPPPEVTLVDQPRVACDGDTGIAAALGHPRQYIQIDDGIGYGECGYCDRRFVLRGGVADQGNAASHA